LDDLLFDRWLGAVNSNRLVGPSAGMGKLLMTKPKQYPDCENQCDGCAVHRDLNCPVIKAYIAKVRKYMAGWKPQPKTESKNRNKT
jgi:hypothetical protein